MTTTETQVYKTYMCLICGFIYDEAAGLPEEGIAPGTRWDDVPPNWTCPECGAAGLPEEGIAPGTRWEDVPPNWTCPECGARKEDFEMVEI